MKNFFEQQAANRRASLLLVCLFSVAVTLIVCFAQWVFGLLFDARILVNLNLILYQGWDVFREQNPYQWHWPSLWVSIAAIFAIGIYKYRQLRTGGKIIAEQLGATRVQPNTFHPLEKQLLNVVEEMAIAARTTVPQVYIQLSHSQVNAFAAGHSSHNAIISVTRGALEKLTRDELQAVVAHEFSHIVNGDIKLNNRLTAATFAISFIGLLGEWILERAAYINRGKRNSTSGIELPIAIVLIGYGYFGTLLADFIKAAICRRREYLADAHAIQFNRNSDALAEALKVAAGMKKPNRQSNYHQYSHLFFSQVRTPWFSSFSTHPPIIKRIQILQPYWQGANKDFKERANIANFQTMQLTATREHLTENKAPIVVSPEYQDMSHLSAQLVQLVHDPYACFSLLPQLLLSEQFTVRSEQLQYLLKSQYVDSYTLDTAESELNKLCPSERYQLIELASPSVACLPEKQKHALSQICWDLVEFQKNTATSDPKSMQLHLTTWLNLELILLQTTKTHSKLRVSNRKQKKLIAAWLYFVSMMAKVSHPSQLEQEAAFYDTCKTFNLKGLTPVSFTHFDYKSAHQLLASLMSLPIKNKNAFLQAIEHTARFDHHLNNAEETLLFSFALLLDLPCPIE